MLCGRTAVVLEWCYYAPGWSRLPFTRCVVRNIDACREYYPFVVASLLLSVAQTPDYICLKYNLPSGHCHLETTHQHVGKRRDTFSILGS